MWYRRSPFLLILSIVFSCILAGCGGGSEGTGGGTIVKALLNDSSGHPISDARVEIVATGESATTDADGMASIESSASLSGKIALSVSGATFAGQVELDIPASASEVTANLRVDGSSVVLESSSTKDGNAESDQSNDPVMNDNGASSGSNTNRNPSRPSSSAPSRPNTPSSGSSNNYNFEYSAQVSYNSNSTDPNSSSTPLTGASYVIALGQQVLAQGFSNEQGLISARFSLPSSSRASEITVTFNISVDGASTTYRDPVSFSVNKTSENRVIDVALRPLAHSLAVSGKDAGAAQDTGPSESAPSANSPDEGSDPKEPITVADPSSSDSATSGSGDATSDPGTGAGGGNNRR